MGNSLLAILCFFLRVWSDFWGSGRRPGGTLRLLPLAFCPGWPLFSCRSDPVWVPCFLIFGPIFFRIVSPRKRAGHWPSIKHIFYHVWLVQYYRRQWCTPDCNLASFIYCFALWIVLIISPWYWNFWIVYQNCFFKIFCSLRCHQGLLSPWYLW